MFTAFKRNESSEINRIAQMIAFFESKECLSITLARYFDDRRRTEPCGHCSTCQGNAHNSSSFVTTLPFDLNLRPLSEWDPHALCQGVVAAASERLSHDMLTCFLCGISNPLFTRIKARSLPNFGCLAQYRYQDVKSWLAFSGL